VSRPKRKPGTAPWRRGVRLGVDVGSVRIGVARSDPDGILATPLVTVPREAAPPGTVTERDRPSTDMSAIAALAVEHEAIEVVVGLPVNLAGHEGLAAASIRDYAAELAKLLDPVPVLFADERMSTAAATRRLSERGVRGRRQRAVVDQAAAVEILQGWLDTRRSPGGPV
jgi:putative holliday junction resolvase